MLLIGFYDYPCAAFSFAVDAHFNSIYTITNWSLSWECFHSKYIIEIHFRNISNYRFRSYAGSYDHHLQYYQHYYSQFAAMNPAHQMNPTNTAAAGTGSQTGSAPVSTQWKFQAL